MDAGCPRIRQSLLSDVLIKLLQILYFILFSRLGNRAFAQAVFLPVSCPDEISRVVVDPFDPCMDSTCGQSFHGQPPGGHGTGFAAVELQGSGEQFAFRVQLPGLACRHSAGPGLAGGIARPRIGRA